MHVSVIRPTQWLPKLQLLGLQSTLIFNYFRNQFCPYTPIQLPNYPISPITSTYLQAQLRVTGQLGKGSFFQRVDVP